MQQRDSVTVRVSTPLANQVRELATQNHRSLTAETAVALERHLAEQSKGEDSK